MGIFNSDGSLSAPVHGGGGGGSIDWTKQQSYNVYNPQTANQHPAQGPISFGTIAHSFLGGLANAVTHPVQTAVGIGKGLVDSAVNAGKTIADFPVEATQGLYHLGAAGFDALAGNKQAAIQHLQQLNQDYQKSYINQKYGSKYAGDTSGLGNAGSFALDMAGLKGGGALIKEGAKTAVEDGLLKAAGKTAAKGAAEGAGFGGAYGVTNAAQQNDLSAGNIAKNVAGGAAAGAVGGAALGGGGALIKGGLKEALSKWTQNRTDMAAAHLQGPPPEMVNGQPVHTPPPEPMAGSDTHVSPDTARQIAQLNHSAHSVQVGGLAKDPVGASLQTATLRNEAAHTMDAIANDRATAAKIDPAQAHEQLATGKDAAALHYQAAQDVAAAAHQEYTRIAHDLPAEYTRAPKAPAEKAAPVDNGPVGSASDVAPKSGSVLEKGFDKLTGNKAQGLVNPTRAASREGNVGLARLGTDNPSAKRLVTFQAKQVRSEFDKLAKGLNHDDINAVIEGATPKDSKVAAAAAFFKAHADAIGGRSADAQLIKGQKENYLPHVATGLESKRGGKAAGLSKSTRYNIERQSIETVDAHGNVVKEDKYKNLADFEAAVKKIDPKAGAEHNTGKLLEHMLTTQGHAIENAKTVEKLMNTRMTDGRPAAAKTTDANLGNQKFKDYAVIDGKLIHPDAKAVYEAISRTGRLDNPFLSSFAKVNSFGKRLVTLAGTIHAHNIAVSATAAHGIARTVAATFGKGPKTEDIVRALSYGLKLSRASDDNAFDEIGKQTGLLGKLDKAMKPADELLFHKFGDRQGMMTYQTIEKKLLKKGLSPDEAGRVAAEFGNQTMHFVSQDQMSVSSRQASQLFLFAGQYFRNILKTATNPIGIGIDRTLSKEGQKAEQMVAIQRVARLFAYSFVSAQAINLATTGKYTWQNGNGDPLNPVWWQTKDKYGNVKQYRITNHYGQLKDVFGLLTNPIGELGNKLAPGAREAISQFGNHDMFTGDQIAKSSDTPLTQAWDRMVHAASNLFTPAGVNLASPSKQPGLVQAAKYAGINSSSTKPNDNFDYAKSASDKKAAQSLIDAYGKGDKSKLAAMQALKASGNGYFDKFFSAHPELDPTSKQFQGFIANNKKEVNDGIAQGFDVAKANGTSLAYMQSVKESGSTYFDKFFNANPNLDPTSNQYDGSGSKQNARQKSEAKYSQKQADYAAKNASKKTGGHASLTTVRHSTKAVSAGKPIKMKIVRAPKKLVGKELIKMPKTKKIGI
jgi:hypothetical protein